MGVLKKDVPVYYREASIFISGRYNREVSIEDAMTIKKKGLEKYGHRLNKIDIKYTSKKSGIHVTYWTLPEKEADMRLSSRDRACFHLTSIVYGKSGDNLPYRACVENEAYGLD